MNRETDMSIFSRTQSNLGQQAGNEHFDADWLGADAWVVPAGLVDRHDEADRRAHAEDAASDWIPL